MFFVLCRKKLSTLNETEGVILTALSPLEELKVVKEKAFDVSIRNDAVSLTTILLKYCCVAFLCVDGEILYKLSFSANWFGILRCINIKAKVKLNRWQTPGGRLNIKMSSYQYRDPHVKDKAVSPTVLSLTRESPYLGKTVLYWDGALVAVSM